MTLQQYHQIIGLSPCSLDLFKFFYKSSNYSLISPLIVAQTSVKYNGNLKGFLVVIFIYHGHTFQMY